MESAVQEPGYCRAGTVQALLYYGARLRRRFWLINLVVSRARVRRLRAAHDGGHSRDQTGRRAAAAGPPRP